MQSLWRFLWIMLPVVLLLGSAIYVPLKLNDDNGLKRVARLQAELEQLRRQNHHLLRENESLARKIKAISSDPNFIENIARNEMGLIAPDEVVYQF